MKRNITLHGILRTGLLLPVLLLVLHSQGTVQEGYGLIFSESGQFPATTALFRYRNDQGTLIWEAGVEAVLPLTRGRIYVDQSALTRTAFALANPFPETVQVRLKLLDDTGLSTGEVIHVLEGRQHEALFVDELFQISSDFRGTLVFETIPAQGIGVITLRLQRNYRGEAIFATFPVVSPSVSGPAGEPPSGVLVFPQIGAGPTISTELVLIGPEEEPTSGMIRFTGSDGLPLELEKDGMAGSEFPFQIEAGGVFSARFRSPTQSLVGYAVVLAGAGQSLPAGSAIFQLHSAGGLISEAGVAAVPPATRSRLFVDNVGTRIGVAVASPGNPGMTITYHLFDLAGTLLASTTRDLPAQGHLPRFVDELFGDLPADFKGTLEVTAPLSFFPITLKMTVNDRGDPILTSLPVNLEGESPAGPGEVPAVVPGGFLILPQIGLGAGITTDLLLVGRQGPSQGTIQFYGSDGLPLGLTLGGRTGSIFDFQVAPGGGLAFESNRDASTPRLPETRLPEYNLPIEPEINPPTSPGLDAPHGGGIDIIAGVKIVTVPGLAGCRPDPVPLVDAGIGQSPGAGVYLHSGEFFLYAVDLEIPGRGFNWRFARKYRSGISYEGALGHNWSFNYERRLILAGSGPSEAGSPGPAAIDVVPGDILRLDGLGRVDVYRLNQDGSYQAPPGFYTRLDRNPDGTFRERDAQGNIARYQAPQDGVARMTSLEDRNHNVMRFEYGESGLLVRVIDTLGRPIDYQYNADGRLVEIRDFIDRQLRFTYDDNGDLTEVISPAITDTPTGNDFPDGRKTVYTYTSGSVDRRLNHNLESIAAPNEAAAADDGSPGSATPRVRIEYDNADQVTAHTAGGVNSNQVPAGGMTVYQEEDGRRRVTDRNGNQTWYSFNVQGQVVQTDELANRPLRPPGSPYGQVEVYTTSRQYNSDGELIETNLPRGNTIRCLYDAGNPDRYQQGNLVRQTRIANDDPSFPHPITSLDQTWTYEPVYNQVRNFTEARGNKVDYMPQNGGTHSPQRYTSTRTFDYQEGNRLPVLAEVVGVDTSRMNDLLEEAGIPLGLGDVNGDGVVNQTAGNVVRQAAPPVHLSPDSEMAAIEGSTLQPRVQFFRYNPVGQMTSSIDPEGNRTSYFYHPENDPDGDGIDPTPGVGVQARGYLRMIRRDDLRSAVRDSRTDPPLTSIRSSFSYDPVGNVVRRVDGRGIATDFEFNEANQVTQVRRAAGHNLFLPEPPEQEPLTDFSYRTQFFYDANGNVIRRRVEDRGNTSGVEPGPVPLREAKQPEVVDILTAWVDFFYRYDILDQLLEESLEVAHGVTLETRHRYDPNGNRVLTIQPEGNAASLQYDERDLLYESTRGAPGPPPLVLLGPGDPTEYDVRGGAPAIQRLNYDPNGNLAETVDAEDTDDSAANNGAGFSGDRTRYTYDGFDRRTSTVDSLGNQTIFQYDPAGNLIRQTRLGPPGSPSPTADGSDELTSPVSSDGQIEIELIHLDLQGAPPLESIEFRYDEAGRTYQVDDLLFVQTTPALREADVADGAGDLGKEDLTPGDNDPIPGLEDFPVIGRVTRRTEYDRNSRPVFSVEDDGDTFRYLYDGVNRRIRTVDPVGNQLEEVFDDADNLIETRETDVATQAQAFLPGSRVFLTTYFWDSLNRLRRSVDNLGQTREYRYDSRDNLVAVADEVGPPGPPIERRFFPSGPRTVDTTNSFGNVTRYFYDGLNRLQQEQVILTASGQGDGVSMGATDEGQKTGTPQPDPTQGGGDGQIIVRYQWDSNSRIRSRTDDNGNVTTYQYDDLNRLTTETSGMCVPPDLADRCDPPTSVHYDYDRDDNLRRKTDENGSIIDYEYDARNRLIRTTVDRGPGVVGTTLQRFEYDGLSRLTRATDNNDPDQVADDSVVEFSYDSLSRVLEDRQQVGDRPMAAVSSAWRGDDLRSSLTYPDERTIRYTYDSLDRIRSVEDDGENTPIANYDYIGRRRLLERRYPQNGTRMTYLDDAGETDVGYDGLRRPVQLRHLAQDNSILVAFSYTYDRMSNRLTQRKLHAESNSERYEYDSAYRLLRFERGKLDSSNSIVQPSPIAHLDLHESWRLDGAGNWPQVRRGNGSLEQREHSSFNEAVRSDNNGFIQDWQYDGNGNWTGTDGRTEYLWDFRNRLSRMRSGGVDRTVYNYDALDRRIRKDSSAAFPTVGPPTGLSHYYLDGPREIQEELLGMFQNWRSQYVHAGDSDDLLVWDLEIESTPASTRSGRYFYHQDDIGSVYALTDMSGKVVEGYQYEAYGRPVAFSPESDGVVRFGDGPSVDPFSLSCANGLCNFYQFAGRRYDYESGLFHFRNRYLNSEQGRFISRDPAGVWSDSRNLGGAYTYVGNNPVNGMDPMGLQGQFLYDQLTPGHPWELDRGVPLPQTPEEYRVLLDRGAEWRVRGEGTVEWQRGEEDWVQIAGGQVLPPGTLVATGFDGQATIELVFEEQVVKAFELESLSVENLDWELLSPGTATIDINIEVQFGEINLDVKKTEYPSPDPCPHCGPVCSPGALHRLWCESCLENRGFLERFLHNNLWMPVSCPHRRGSIPPLGGGGGRRG